MEQIKLDECPEPLRDSVNEYLENHKAAKIVLINTHKSTPYRDRSIERTCYKAYLEWGNLLSVLTFSICTKEEWSDYSVSENFMMAGDIDVFLNHSWWFRRIGRRSEYEDYIC